ncbi:MAG: sugar ABC transporter permease [Clostridiales bacterium]|nr:sugar ABC transporter permease [Clostridiales bacterium]
MEKKQALHGYLFLLPTVILFVIFSFVTVIMGFVYSFTDMAPGAPDMFNWTLYNYKYIFQDKIFLHSILNVLVYAAISVPLTIVTSLLVAALLNRKLRGVKFFRVIYYLPAVTSGIATAFVWRWLYNDTYGLFNTILTQWFGMKQGISWVSAQSYFAMFCIALVSTWSGLGGNMLIYLASMQSISPELYEAASLDGANGWQKLMKITVPMLRSTTFFIITMSLIGSFQLFDIVALIGAGDNYYTQTPVTQIEASFRHGEGGMASAQSVILFIVIMVVTFLTQGIVKEKQA